MRRKLHHPSPEEDLQIARGILADPDAAPDLSQSVAGIVRQVGRPRAPNPKVSVTLRLDRDVVDRFKASGAGWQTRINAALRRAVDA
jgi:uncharacterized protein (DUF4415 family)